MEGLNRINQVETIEAGDKNMEAQKRIAEMFGGEITPKQVVEHGVLTERI